jgi:hypothetical protein
VVPWWYQSRTRVVPLGIYDICFVLELYLSGTYRYLSGTFVIPMWYMCGTCPCRPEQVFKLLQDLGRSLYCMLAILLFGTWLVPLSYQ